tara:strand:- start:17 stop:238 length:222 start_codon:yes stop_codon:yes gene_type:complete
MLEGKDLMSLDLHIIQGLKEQLTMQETSVLYLVRPGKLSVSTQIAMEKDYLDGLAQDLTKKIDAIVLTEATAV